jgi:hypothetical protein
VRIFSRHVAHLLGRAAHIDVDDLRAPVHVVAGRLGHHPRLGAGNLHRDRLHLARVVGAAHGLLALPELGVGRHHLGHRVARAQLLAQLAERPVRHPGHGGDEQVVAKTMRTDLHDRNSEWNRRT